MLVDKRAILNKPLLTMRDIADLCGFTGSKRCERAFRTLRRLDCPINDGAPNAHRTVALADLQVYAQGLYESILSTLGSGDARMDEETDAPG